jgi:hypothetical protein
MDLDSRNSFENTSFVAILFVSRNKVRYLPFEPENIVLSVVRGEKIFEGASMKSFNIKFHLVSAPKMSGSSDPPLPQLFSYLKQLMNSKFSSLHCLSCLSHGENGNSRNIKVNF